MAKVQVQTFGAFKRATIEEYERHRILASVWGEPGSRKTSFGLEGPGPVAVLSFDQGLEGVVDRQLKLTPNKQIWVKEYEWMPSGEDDIAQANELRDVYAADFEYALQNARTVLLDKEPDIWQLYRFAEGLTGGDEQKNYDKVNMQYRRLINMAKASNANVLFISGCKDEWGTVVKRNGQSGSGPTGNRIRTGFKDLVGLIHIDLHFEGLSEDSWQMTVGKVRGPGGQALAGQTFGGMPFAEFAQLVFPDSLPEEWE